MTWLIYKAQGPREPIEGEPSEPTGKLKYLGHVHFGKRVPYDYYRVFVDEAGVFWAKLSVVPGTIFPESLSDLPEP